MLMKKTIITILLLICVHTCTVNAQQLQWNHYQSPGGMIYQTNYNKPVVYTNAHTCNQYCEHATSTTYVVIEKPPCQPVMYIPQTSVTIVISPKKYYKKRRPTSSGIVKKYVYRDSAEYIYEEEVYREITP